jgi:hypothetical protein
MIRKACHSVCKIRTSNAPLTIPFKLLKLRQTQSLGLLWQSELLPQLGESNRGSSYTYSCCRQQSHLPVTQKYRSQFAEFRLGCIFQWMCSVYIKFQV